MTTGTTQRFALFGHPVSHSWSPFIHGLFARQTGIDMSYRLVDSLPERFRTQAMQFFLDGGRGINVTVPHKQAAAELVNELTPRAARAQAVNTLLMNDASELLGDNTDGIGLVTDLTVNLRVEIHGRRVLVLGAGGATRGVIGPLLELRPRALTVANRTAVRAVELASEFADLGKVRGCGFADIDAEPYDLVINATSASLQGEVPPVPAGALGSQTVCYDMAYAKSDTPFTAWAKARGLTRVHKGWGMLVEQAAESFLLWHGVRPQTKPVAALLASGNIEKPKPT